MDFANVKIARETWSAWTSNRSTTIKQIQNFLGKTPQPPPPPPPPEQMLHLTNELRGNLKILENQTNQY